MNRFTRSLAIVTTLSYHNYKIAITITQPIDTFQWTDSFLTPTATPDTRTSQLTNQSQSYSTTGVYRQSVRLADTRLETHDQ
jgi:hypothetical protein